MSKAASRLQSAAGVVAGGEKNVGREETLSSPLELHWRPTRQHWKVRPCSVRSTARKTSAPQLSHKCRCWAGAGCTAGGHGGHTAAWLCVSDVSMAASPGAAASAAAAATPDEAPAALSLFNHLSILRFRSSRTAASLFKPCMSFMCCFHWICVLKRLPQRAQTFACSIRRCSSRSNTCLRQCGHLSLAFRVLFISLRCCFFRVFFMPPIPPAVRSSDLGVTQFYGVSN
mmetsp:Transcript_66798/g.123367  ORF Transcript_66798/g.123367 Transcript_66798/m.123367 type:complete len:229 (+) Transcript_66798:116-802(+)